MVSSEEDKFEDVAEESTDNRYSNNGRLFRNNMVTERR